MEKMNGIETESLKETCALLAKEPQLGESHFRIKNTWKEGGNNRVTIGGFYAAGEEQLHQSSMEFDADEPLAFLGTDKGANPVEYLLTALSSCMTTSIVYHSAANGYKIHSLESEFEGDLDIRGFLNIKKNIPKGYQNIRVTFRIDTEAPKEEIAKFYQFSPVYSMVSSAVPIEVDIVKL